jgi:hypothetical protein
MDLISERKKNQRNERHQTMRRRRKLPLRLLMSYLRQRVALDLGCEQEESKKVNTISHV